MHEAVILSATRTPIGSFHGAFRDIPATSLGSTAIAASLRRAGLRQDQVDEVIMGCVLSAGVGQAPARQAALGAGIPNATPATTVNKVCGSGLKAVIMAAQSIALGQTRTAVAGGMESMSRTPYLLPRNHAGTRLGDLAAVDGLLKDGLWDVYEDISMGVAVERYAQQCHFSREELDDYAIESYRRVREARAAGRFEAEVEPVSVSTVKEQRLVRDDEEPERLDIDKMRKLKPAFTKDGMLTAGNSTSCNDGAAAIVLMAEDAARLAGLEPLVRIRGYAEAGVPPALFAMAPVEATKRALAMAGLTIEDIDLFEINEPFSAAAIGVVRTLGLDPTRVNVNGGAIALGHPIGATGARILTTLVHAMCAHNVSLGLATLCIGGGEAAAIVVERERVAG
ncbi:MAG: thiolase family protein [Nitrospiraceae bacterium]|nr:thiolase family protein [Nitrospiraceae bacterium]